MQLSNLDLEKIYIGLLKGKGLILPPCKNLDEYDDMVSQVENYIENFEYSNSSHNK